MLRLQAEGVQLAIDAHVAAGFAKPVWVKFNADGWVCLHFEANDTAEVDRWANLLGATVAADDFTYCEGEAPFHEYGTLAGAEGLWMGWAVALLCPVLGPAVPREAS